MIVRDYLAQNFKVDDTRIKTVGQEKSADAMQPVEASCHLISCPTATCGGRAVIEDQRRLVARIRSTTGFQSEVIGLCKTSATPSSIAASI